MSIKQHQTRKGIVYEARFRGPGGREVSRRFRTKREAAAWEATQVAAVARGTYLDPAAANRTLKTVADEWLASNPAKRATSISRDVSVLRKHIVPAFGHRRIGSVTKPEVQKLVNEWTTQMQPRTVVRTYGTLRAVFNYAVASDWIGRSPCRDINLPKRKATKRRVPTPDELVALADAMRSDYAPMVWVGVVAGLRWGEVAGLRVRHVDVLRRTINVEEQVARGEGGITIVAAPKSDAGTRMLTIPPSSPTCCRRTWPSGGSRRLTPMRSCSPDLMASGRWRTRTGVGASGNRRSKPPTSKGSGFTTCGGPTRRRWCSTTST